MTQEKCAANQHEYFQLGTVEPNQKLILERCTCGCYYPDHWQVTIEQPITCEQCGMVFEHGNTNASARFDFCSQICQDVHETKKCLLDAVDKYERKDNDGE